MRTYADVSLALRLLLLSPFLIYLRYYSSAMVNVLEVTVQSILVLCYIQFTLLQDNLSRTVKATLVICHFFLVKVGVYCPRWTPVFQDEIGSTVVPNSRLSLHSS
jgi:hypothetical protein